MGKEEEPLLKTFVQQHPEVSQRLAAIFGDEAALERGVRQGTSCWTSIPSLDTILGRLPLGIVDLNGPESAGKTGLLFEIGASAQKEGRPVIFWANETIDVPYMERIGMDTKHLPVLLGIEGEEDFFDFARSHEDAVLLLDSFTALRPKGEKALTDWNDMAWDFLRRLRTELQDGSCVVMTSQVRAKLGSRGTRSASRRFEDLFDTQLELSREEVSEKWYEMLVNVKAHTITVPHRYTRLPFVKGMGVDKELDAIRCAVNLGVITQKPGGWLSLLDVVNLGQGEAQAVQKIHRDKELRERILALIYEKAPGGGI
jgi:hypothetical protein